MIPLALFFFLNIALAIQGILCFHTNFRSTCSSDVKNAIGNLTNWSYTNRDSFISSFQIWMSFIYFSCLITLPRNSSTILSRSGENKHPCLVSDLRGKAFSFSPLSMMKN